MSRYRAIIFDFDYTLADSSPGIVECINYSLRELGLPPVSQEAACRTIGFSLTKAFVTLAGEAHSTHADEFNRLFKVRADEIMVARTSVFPGVPEVIAQLKQSGYLLGIVSNKFRYRIEAVLERDCLTHYFDTIVGAEDFRNHKPDPEGLLAALERLGVTPAHALYVGDSTTDAETAQRADTEFVAVLTGVTTRDEFMDYRFLHVVPVLSDLPELLENYTKPIDK